MRRNASICRIQLTVLAIIVSVAACASAQSAWTVIDMPTLSGFSGPTFAHLSSGRLIYGENNNLYLQGAWRSSAFTQYSNLSGTSFDPSFVAVGPGDAAAMGAGGSSGASTLYRIDNPASTATGLTTVNPSILNYDGVFRDSTSLFVGGGYYDFSGGGGSIANQISYQTLDGSTTQLLIENISTYSAGIALDSSGNLYTGADTGEIYRFSKSLLDQAIADQSLLTVDSAGVELVCTFANGVGSLAVDSSGVLWSAGWKANGISFFDGSGYGSITPGPDNSNYSVGTFSYDGSEYLAYLNNAGWGSGKAVSYGYAAIEAIPEPSAAAMVLLGAVLLAVRRLREVVGAYVQ